MARAAFTKYSPAIRDKALALAREVGVNRAADKLKISRSKITTWRIKSGDAISRGTKATTRLLPAEPSTNGSRNYHTADEKMRVLEIASRIGVEAAATETGLSSSMIYAWRKKAQRSTTIAPLWMEGFRAGFKEGFTLGKELT